MDTVDFNAESNPAMDQNPNQGGGSRNTPSRYILRNPRQTPFRQTTKHKHTTSARNCAPEESTVLDLLKYVLTCRQYSFYVRNALINVFTINSFYTIPTITDKRLGTNLHFRRFLPNKQSRPNTTSPAQLPLPHPHPTYSDEHWCLQFFGVSTLQIEGEGETAGILIIIAERFQTSEVE